MQKKHILIVIITIAALVRLINLSSGDITGSDEVFYSFRGIGMLDFDNAPQQTSPLQWQDPNIQWWTHLSFSDHPPLVFLLEHWSMKVFGENNFGFRLPSALLGIASIYLIYLLAKKLISERAALISATIAAITVNTVYISRLGLQESCVVFFLLLCSYLFLKALDDGLDAREAGVSILSGNKKYFLWTGAALGLGLLAKYNVFVMVPIMISYLAIFRRDVFRKKTFWLGIAFAVLVFSPVIIYNLMMYKTTGHFDFQFSYVFGQNPDVWKSAPGKEAMPTYADRLSYFFPYLFNTNSLTLLALAALSLLTLFKKKNAFIIISIFWMLVLLARIGPTYRFLTMLTPFLILSIGTLADRFIDPFKNKIPKWILVLLATILAWEAFYTLNSVVTNYPLGANPWTFSHVRYDNYNWGYNALADYFDAELAGKYPGLTFDSRYQFLEKIKADALGRARQSGDKPFPALIVYDGNIASPAQLWIFDRLQIYHGWPVMMAGEYLSDLAKNGQNYFRSAGIGTTYFITPSGYIPLKTESLGGVLTDNGARLEQTLIKKGINPSLIKNQRGETVFRIYKF